MYTKLSIYTSVGMVPIGYKKAQLTQREARDSLGI